MVWLRSVYARIRGLLRAGAIYSEIDEEMRFHVEMRTEENIRRGLAPEAARRQAEASFGNQTRIREQGYEVRSGRWLETFWQDLRYAGRTLRNNPLFTIITVLMLAFGIGVNTAIFTLFNSLALRSLPVREAGQVVNVYVRSADGSDYRAFSYPAYVDYRDRTKSLSGLSAYARTKLTLTGSSGSEAESINALLVSSNYFSVLGTDAFLGRTLLPEEDQVQGSDSPIVLGHSFWQRRFGSDRNVLGKKLTLNSHSFTIVGVTSPDFTGLTPLPPDVWVPLMMQDQLLPGEDRLRDRGSYWLEAVGRLKPGISREQAQAEMGVITSQLAQAYPDHKAETLLLTPGTFLARPDVRGKVTAVAVLVMVLVGLVLLIACLNVANLLLARAATRQREIAVRLAVGATRGRLVRQMLTESFLLAVLSGAVGLVLAFWFADLLLKFVQLPGQETLILNVRPDFRVFGYTAILSLLTSVGFGLIPALQASRPNLTSALKDEGGLFGRRFGRSRLRDLFVIAQVSMCLVLLINAGLLFRALQIARSVDPGFETKKVLAVSLDLRLHGYAPSRGAEFQHQLLERLRSFPGVKSASLAATVPLGESRKTTSLLIEGMGSPSTTQQPAANYNLVSPTYFETLGIPLIQGRAFNSEDTTSGSPVAVVNEALARQFWPNENPIGKRLRSSQTEPYREVVGVVKDTRNTALWEADARCLYFPVRFVGDSAHLNGLLDLIILIRTEGDPKPVMATLPRVVSSLDNRLQINVKPLEENLDRWIATSRIGAMLSIALGLLALLLATIGIYGAIAYAVSQRTHEIGIRLALGAQKSDVLRLILGKGLRLVSVGLVLGLTGAAIVSRFLSSFLYGLNPLDPLAFVVVSLILSGVAMLATYLPTRQVMQVDPLVALRYQ